MPTTPLPDTLTMDTIRVPRQLGLPAVRILGTRASAVVEDPVRASLYFFVPDGTAIGWSVENTEALPDGAATPIPPERRTSGPGPHWRVCPGEDGRLTDPAALTAALADAAGLLGQATQGVVR
ncbi:hypothetical protein [Streptomyces fumanus]|uniref:hypothetical protein n=1 Tax=Streptomyces fumanus TaxID=67302 RepID=UPI0033DB0B7A